MNYDPMARLHSLLESGAPRVVRMSFFNMGLKGFEQEQWPQHYQLRLGLWIAPRISNLMLPGWHDPGTYPQEGRPLLLAEPEARELLWEMAQISGQAEQPFDNSLFHGDRNVIFAPAKGTSLALESRSILPKCWIAPLWSMWGEARASLPV